MIGWILFGIYVLGFLGSIVLATALDDEPEYGAFIGIIWPAWLLAAGLVVLTRRVKRWSATHQSGESA